MQKITNKHNLPVEVYNALCKDRYNADSEESGQEPARKTDYSVTTLVAPIQQTVLRGRYPACNSEDAVDRVWSLFGHIAHALLEEHGSDETITEKRFYMQVKGKTISGQVDLYKDKKITDYKTTGTYKVQKRSYDDWQKQLNCYATLCEENGLQVEILRIIAILRDWSESDAYQKDYPEAPIVEIPLLKWSAGARMRYIEERVQLIINNELLPDGCLMRCTDEERWATFRDYAVFKIDEHGNRATKATKVFKNDEEAVEFRRSKGPNYECVRRTNPPRRCLKYCNVSSVCHQHAQYLKEQGAEDGQQSPEG